MDPDWVEVARLKLPPQLSSLVSNTPVIPMVFDNAEELFWVSSQYGRVSSFYGTELSKYTAFVAHPQEDGPVRQILVHEKGVIALGPRSVHMALRTGPPRWHIIHEEMVDLRCMTFTSKDAKEILVAGAQDVMFTIDVDKGEVTKTIPALDQYIIMKRSRYICAATTTGSVNILDSTNFSLVKTWTGHAAYINDMDAQHDFIVTCGFSFRAGQNYMLDPLVNVFDIKNLTSLPPIPFPAGAAYVRMHPKMSTTTIVTSSVGQLHIVDLMNVNTSNVRQISTSAYLAAFEISASGESFAFADQESNVQLWGSPSRVRFTEVSRPTEFPSPMENHQPVGWNDNIPLNTFGMPYYREQLLSAWQSNLISDVGAPPPKMDPQLLSAVKVDIWGAYTSNPKTKKRNQVENTRLVEKSSEGVQAPKFLSEKARESANNGGTVERRMSDLTDTLSSAEFLGLKADVPVIYRNVEIKYSKFGVDDFDFGYYNRTRFSGLEIHISNSYANPLLQIMHFTPLMRNMALQHAATVCISELCFLCEMGFLFDMLEKAEGSICQATNLLKTFSNHPKAASLHLLEEDAPRNPLTNMLQSLTSFFMEKITLDYKSVMPNSMAMDEVLTTSAKTAIRCTNCGNEHERPGATLVTELLYPLPKPGPRNNRLPQITFSQVLKSSMEREATSRGWCVRCQRYSPLASRKNIDATPSVLMLNAAITSPEVKQLWAIPGWLPDEIGVIVEQGQFYCYEGEDLKLHIQRRLHVIKVYSLIGIAAEIESGQQEMPHLVALVNVANSAREAQKEDNWHLFNDFLVRPVKKAEALAFNTAWKLPSVIAYQVKTANNLIDDSWKRSLDTALLYADRNINPSPKTYLPLDRTKEHPGPGTIIAIDTEFVSIRQPEIAMNSDGERETIRPITYRLARVSVIRGSSSAFIPTLDEGTPFIDDYIATTEPIVDYLTSFSGIVAGDLDPRTSKHNLLPLKVAYKKLWLLLNLGCTFLGHGLKQDFRVINIQVPKSQIIDTADCFYVAARLRKLSLAFLAWYVLREDIQQETHDSIEDARTALKLYGKYVEYVDAGILDTVLSEIYKRGRELNFKPPSRKADGMITGPMAPQAAIMVEAVRVRRAAAAAAAVVTNPPVADAPAAGASTPSTTATASTTEASPVQSQAQLQESQPPSTSPATSPEQ